MNASFYPAKVLLFGEYTVIKGGKALALPLPSFGGEWKMAVRGSEHEQQKGLYLLLDYLKNNFSGLYNLEAFAKELSEGLYFDSDIPQGYGAGSSGAVTAAVYDRFALQKITPETSSNLEILQKQLANIESCFHGASSGADPLVSYLRKGVLFGEGNRQLLEEEQSKLNGFFLVDTGISRQTAPLVNKFKEWCKDEIYPQRLEAELMPLVEEGIDAFLNGNVSVLLESVHQIGYFQFKYFSEMIPKDCKTAWLDALTSDHTKLKLCGAGGGGFLLGYSTNLFETKKLLANQTIVTL
ncbi:MAG: mevalonate kinase [Saprospiraceae bacterium]